MEHREHLDLVRGLRGIEVQFLNSTGHRLRKAHEHCRRVEHVLNAGAQFDPPPTFRVSPPPR